MRRFSMSEQSPEPIPTYPASTEKKESNAVAIASIIAMTIIMLSCILACTITAYAFLMNPPW
jgi:hypothetical protein